MANPPHIPYAASMPGKRRINLVWLGVALAVAVWLLEAALHAYFIGSGSFAANLLPHDTNELWMRLVIVGLIIGAFGFTESHMRYQERLRDSKERLIQAQYVAQMGDFIWDFETGDISWSQGLRRLLQYDETGHMDDDRITREILHPGDRERVTAWFDAAIESAEETLPPNEHRLIRKNGETVWVRTHGRFEIQGGKAVRLFGTCQDITKRKKVEEKLAYLSYYDELTGLPNRRLFAGRTASAIRILSWIPASASPCFRKTAKMPRPCFDTPIRRCTMQKNNRTHIHYFSAGMEEKAARHMMLEQDLAQAADEKQLQLYYQGQHTIQPRSTPLSLHDPSKHALHTHGIIGVEGLLRWPHPKPGMISPAEFVPLAEETGLIWPLTRWVLLRGGPGLRAICVPCLTCKMREGGMGKQHIHQSLKEWRKAQINSGRRNFVLATLECCMLRLKVLLQDIWLTAFRAQKGENTT